MFMSIAVFILAVYSLTLVWNYRRDTIMRNDAAVQSYIETCQKRMETRKNNLLHHYKDHNLYELIADAKTDDQKKALGSEMMTDCTKELVLTSDIIGYVLMYDNNTKQDYIFRHGERSGFAAYAMSLLGESYYGTDKIDAWRAVNHMGTPYLSYSYGVRGVSLTVFFNLPSTEAYGENTEWVFLTQEELEKAAYSSDRTDGGTVYEDILGRKADVLASGTIPETNMNVYASAKLSRVLTPSFSTVFIFLAGILTFTFALISRRYIKKVLGRPLTGMEETITQISEEGTGIYMSTATGIAEYDRIGNEFNRMLDQIRDLKIEQYEHTIAHQRTMMQFLKMQLKPHFILNCLTSLYSMLQQNKLEKLGDRIIDLSNYLRYELQSDEGPRPLAQEIEFSDSVVEIRKDAYTKEIIVRESVPDELLRAKVPPMLLETFIENSIKYAEPEEDLEIDIAVNEQMLFDEPYLRIHITDNGKGYSEQFLKAFADADEEKIGNHIGLNNLRKRLEILYHGKAVMHIGNNDGAVNDILIPLEMSDV